LKNFLIKPKENKPGSYAKTSILDHLITSWKPKEVSGYSAYGRRSNTICGVFAPQKKFVFDSKPKSPDGKHELKIVAVSSKWKKKE